MDGQKITELYEKYLEDTRKASAEDARGLGVVSRLLSSKPSKAEELMPAFDAGVAAAINEISDQNPSSAELRRLGEWMLEQSLVYKNETQAKYSFMAVMRHLTPMTGLLSAEDARGFAEKLEASIPRRERFPVVEDLIKKLKKR